MTSPRTRSALGSLLTAGCELVVFAACAAALGAKGLLAARWLVGASGSTASFFVNRRWAFGDRSTPKRAQGPRFALITVAGVSLGTALWALLVHGTPLDPRLAQVLSMVGVWALFTFPMMKRWVFHPDRAPTGSTECDMNLRFLPPPPAAR